MPKISDKNDKFLSNYSHLFWGPLFIGTECIYVSLSNIDEFFKTLSMTHSAINLQNFVIKDPTTTQKLLDFSLQNLTLTFQKAVQ